VGNVDVDDDTNDDGSVGGSDGGKLVEVDNGSVDARPADGAVDALTGRRVFAGKEASYKSPGMSGASAFCMSFTSALRGPQGVNTAKRSYRANKTSSTHAVQASKCDSCQETIIDVAIR
jgi:hypothetical protein